MAIDRRLADQVYEDRQRELRLKGWRNEEIHRKIRNEFGY